MLPLSPTEVGGRSSAPTDRRHFSLARRLLAPRGMFHHTARAREGLLFHDPTEARRLWDTLVLAAPGLNAACAMPNHVHLQHPRDVRVPLAQALAGYARWLNARRGLGGPLFEPLPEPVLKHGDKIARDERYIHLNPCRARLVADPLAWPWSTHRDAVGLSLVPARPRVRDPDGYHRHVSGDPSVRVQGTELPVDRGVTNLFDLFAASADLTRTPDPLMRRRGLGRTVFVRAARALTEAPSAEIGALVGLEASAVRKVPRRADAAVALVARVAGDPRFVGLPATWRPR